MECVTLCGSCNYERAHQPNFWDPELDSKFAVGVLLQCPLATYLLPLLIAATDLRGCVDVIVERLAVPLCVSPE